MKTFWLKRYWISINTINKTSYGIAYLILLVIGTTVGLGFYWLTLGKIYDGGFTMLFGVVMTMEFYKKLFKVVWQDMKTDPVNMETFKKALLEDESKQLIAITQKHNNPSNKVKML